MFTKLQREDIPDGLGFCIGYEAAPGSRLIFITSTAHGRRESRAMGDFHVQTEEALRVLSGRAARVDSAARLVKVRRQMSSSRGVHEIRNQRLWEEVFNELPPSTALDVPGTTFLDSVVDIEGWALAPVDEDVDPVVRIFGEDPLPQAVSVRGDQRLVVAAVRPSAQSTLLDELASGLDQLDAEFSRLGAAPGETVKLTVYLRDPRSWTAIESALADRFGKTCPAVTGVVVSNLLAPGAHVEVTGWARAAEGRSDAGISLEDRLLILTGTGAIPVFIGGPVAAMYAQSPSASIVEQTHVAMENQCKVLESAGATFADVFRSNWYLSDIREWPTMEPIVADYFGGTIPVPQVVEVARLTAKPGVRFEPDLWATVPASHGRSD